jgi:hypothetical protein
MRNESMPANDIYIQRDIIAFSEREIQGTMEDHMSAL